MINSALDLYFPEGCGVDILGKLGRYYVTSAFTLAVSIIAKKEVLLDQPGREGRRQVGSRTPFFPEARDWLAEQGLVLGSEGIEGIDSCFRETYNQIPSPPRYLFSIFFFYECSYFMKIKIKITLGSIDTLLTPLYRQN